MRDKLIAKVVWYMPDSRRCLDRASEMLSWCYGQITRRSAHHFWRITVECKPVDESEFKKIPPNVSHVPLEELGALLSSPFTDVLLATEQDTWNAAAAVIDTIADQVEREDLRKIAEVFREKAQTVERPRLLVKMGL